MLLNQAKPIVFAITESWCNVEDNMSSLCLNGRYNMYRSDRKTHAGGVLVLTHSSLSVKHILSISIDNLCELVCIDILPSHVLKMSRPLRLVTAYRTPGSSPQIKLAGTKLIHEIQSLLLPDSHSHIIQGDFNAPSVDWNSFRATEAFDRSLMNFASLHSLSQMVRHATMVRRVGRRAHTLDIVLTDSISLFQCVRVMPRFSVAFFRVFLRSFAR